MTSRQARTIAAALYFSALTMLAAFAGLALYLNFAGTSSDTPSAVAPGAGASSVAHFKETF